MICEIFISAVESGGRSKTVFCFQRRHVGREAAADGADGGFAKGAGSLLEDRNRLSPASGHRRSDWN